MKNLLKNSKLLAGFIFFCGLFQRIMLDISFWEKYGWQASHLTEIWIYCRKATQNLNPQTRDVTLYLLRLIGKTFPETYLLHAVSIFAAILSSLTGVVIFYLVKNLLLPNTKEEKKEPDYFIPLAAGLFYTGISSVQALSAVSFTHDLVQMPVMLGFLALVVAFWKKFNSSRDWKMGLRKNWFYLAASLVLSYIGYNINPVFLLTLPFFLIYSIFQFLYHRGKKIKHRNVLLLYISFLLVLILIRYVFYDEVIQILHAILWKLHGIDLLYILGQNSKDLVPTDLDKKFLDLYVLCFFLPFGFYAAYKNRRVIAPTFFLLGLFLATIMDRGSRLLNIATAMLASYAFWYRQKFYILDYVIAGILIITLLLNPGSSILKWPDKIVYLLLPLVLVWAFKKYFQKYTKITKKKVYTIALLVLLFAPSFQSLFLYKYWIKPGLTQGEYAMAQWIKNNITPGEKIFLNWGEAHYYDFLTSLEPVNRLAKTDLDPNKIYWQPEEEAVAYAETQGIKYFLVNSEDFVFRKLPDSRIAYMFRGATPENLKTEQIARSFLYQMVYEPRNLKRVKLIHEEEDRATGRWVRIFQIKENF